MRKVNKMKENYSVFSIRTYKGFTEEYCEDDYSTLAEAKEVADKLYDYLTAAERKYNSVEVRTNITDMAYDVVYKR